MESHAVYESGVQQFRKDDPEYCRKLETERIAEIGSCLSDIAENRTWLLSVVTKQDLWWSHRKLAEKFYRSEDYASAIPSGNSRILHEICFLSLIISNLLDANKKVIANTVAGYDTLKQTESLVNFLVCLGRVLDWETRNNA